MSVLSVKLKTLFITLQNSTKFLNQLNQLEELRICKIETNSNDLKLTTLRLVMLKHLSINTHLGFSQLILDLSALENFDYKSDIKNVKINHPKSIHRLSTLSYAKKIDELINLEYLLIESFNNQTLFDLIKDLANLKELHLKILKFDQKKTEINFDNLFSFIFKQKQVHKRLNLIIYYHGIKVDNFKEVQFINQDIDYSASSTRILNERIYIENYSDLCTALPWVNNMNYSNLANLVDKLPSDFYAKFFNIYEIYVSEQLNELQFINFLKNYHHLKKLSLKNSELKQTFYDELKSVCP